MSHTCVCGHSEIRHAIVTLWCMETVEGRSCRGCEYYTAAPAGFSEDDHFNCKRTVIAQVVMRGFESDCAIGICPNWCSHLMWQCAACTSEGGWGAERPVLEAIAAAHVCPVSGAVEGNQ